MRRMEYMDEVDDLIFRKRMDARLSVMEEVPRTPSFAAMSSGRLMNARDFKLRVIPLMKNEP